MAAEVIAIASDHSGVDFKETLKEALGEVGFQVLDLGTNDYESVDYPDFAEALTLAIGFDTWVCLGQAERTVLGLATERAESAA